LAADKRTVFGKVETGVRGKQTYKFCNTETHNPITYIKIPTNALGFMDIIVLHSDHEYVSATYVAIFRTVRTRIQI